VCEWVSVSVSVSVWEAECLYECLCLSVCVCVCVRVFVREWVLIIDSSKNERGRQLLSQGAISQKMQT
jgi:hypothetical protein